MGAGASALPATIDKQTALSLAGADFDETAFDAAAKNGVVAKHDFLAAAERVRPTDTTSKCAALFTAFNECMDKAIAAEATNEEAAKVATDAFWEGQARQSCWVVPMGDESTFTRHCGLLVALERARAAGKTPLLVDNSEDRLIDTYYSYQPAQVLDAKKLVLDERKGVARDALLEQSRVQLVRALRYGQALYIRLSNAACDFCNKYSSADTLPLQVFDAPAVEALNAEYGAEIGRHADAADEAAEHVGANLWGAQGSPFATVLREADTDKGVFVPRRGFEVVLCTHLGARDFDELLAGKLPMTKLQPIAVVPQVASRGPSAACPPIAAHLQNAPGGEETAGEQSSSESTAAVEALLSVVETRRREVAEHGSSEAKEALATAVIGLVVEVGTWAAQMAEGECDRLDGTLVAHAATFRSGLLRSLKSCAACAGLSFLPNLAEQARRMLATTPAKFATSLTEALLPDVDACADLHTLERVQETLDLMIGQGKLRSQLGESAYSASVALPEAHKTACRTAALRAKKRHEGLKVWRRAQQLKASEGRACVRFEGANEAIDLVDRRDGRGYIVAVRELEEIFQIPKLFDGTVSHSLVQEDVTNTFDVRAWMARPQVVGCDGPPKAPEEGIFSHLTPNCQFRLETNGKRMAAAPVVEAGTGFSGAFANLKLLEEDDVGIKGFQCTCQVGKPCGQCAATAFRS